MTELREQVARALYDHHGGIGAFKPFDIAQDNIRRMYLNQADTVLAVPPIARALRLAAEMDALRVNLGAVRSWRRVPS